MRCSRCMGTGKIMGLGMIYKDCDCDDGQILEASEIKSSSIAKPVTIDKRSKAYKEAIDNIMQAHDISREEAVVVFESEFDKIA
jgi:hypothetical protein